MRAHGRLVKNIAGLLLLLALLSLLLPFCRFNAGAGDMTLSGIEVLKSGGKAGYTYFKTGGLSDDFVIKSPYTWGNIKESILYINEAGGAKIMVFCGAAIAVPIILCFLSMIMLFMAEGKKTMFLPTLFTFVVSAEMILGLLLFTQLRPFLMIGVYLFTLLNVLALIFIMTGWITGGYRQPDRRRSRYDSANDDVDDNSNKNGSRRKKTRRKTRRKKKTKKKTKKEKSSDKDNDKKENDDKKDGQKNKPGEAVTGVISNGSGIYHGLTWNLRDGSSSSVTIGTTCDAMDALGAKSLKGMNSIAGNNCKITFDATAKKYNIESHSKANILILQDGQVVKWLKNGDSYEVAAKAVMQIEGRRDAVRLG
ncbi:hypothetical protein KQI69_10050 [Eubacterium sp. MSJ-13]|uniref:hypothetical protein n=1 Tax=Eubacterium sp. MSJ-13 TaxID=2841513 RepID=UPI001C105D3A|nr:hypothetical protein [Eubacterium sp. MSJ-13]MBU5479545.1 hypothetical protein [Eubacterium sp. MSJ-13]